MKPVEEELSDILNLYQDNELDLYQLTVSEMLKGNLELLFDKVEVLGDLVLWHGEYFKKVKPTFFDFLNHSQEMVSGFAGNLGRQSLSRVILFEDEVYELSFKTQGMVAKEKRKFTFKDAKIRMNGDRSFKKEHFLDGLPVDFINRLSENQSFSIVIKLIEKNKSRTNFEEKSGLVDTKSFVGSLLNPENLASKIKNNPVMISDNSLERLKLWGIDSNHSKGLDILEIFKTLPPTDFGIKNVSHLRHLINNSFSNNTISNEELLQEPASVMAYTKELKDLKNKLLNKEPWVCLPLK